MTSETRNWITTIISMLAVFATGLTMTNLGYNKVGFVFFVIALTFPSLMAMADWHERKRPSHMHTAGVCAAFVIGVALVIAGGLSSL